MRFSTRAIFLLILLIAFAILGGKQFFGPIFPRSTLDRIKVGDSQQRVIEILGKPNGASTKFAWCYERALNPGWLAVEFDSNGLVVNIDHERP